MSTTTLFHVLVIVVLTLISGISDAQGFVHSARIWQDGKVLWNELGLAALGYAVGISLYWVSLPSMRAVGMVSPEIQAISWFAVTIVGVALASRAFFGWQPIDQIVGVAVLLGIAWLLVRTGE